MKKLLPLVIAAFLIFATSCGKDDGNIPETSETDVIETTIPETSPETSENTETTTYEETTGPETTAETETSGSDDETQQVTLLDYFVPPDPDTRPVAIMIDNEGWNSYPQGGIEKAQIVYELIAEWGETRLVPVFYGLDSGNVGPVRSIRHYFIQFAMEYDPILVHIGFSPLGERMIENNNLASINGLYSETYSIFFDITKIEDNWQDTYTKFEYLKNFIARSNFRKEPSKQFPFVYAETDFDGSTAEDIRIKYSASYNVGFVYDSATELYARYRKGSYHIERYTGDVLAAKNIIVQIVVTYPIKNDTEGRMTMDNVGSGVGYFITKGKCKEITWEKASDFSQTVYRYADSNENITLNEGQTWIMVVAKDSDVDIN